MKTAEKWVHFASFEGQSDKSSSGSEVNIPPDAREIDLLLLLFWDTLSKTLCGRQTVPQMPWCLSHKELKLHRWVSTTMGGMSVSSTMALLIGFVRKKNSIQAYLPMNSALCRTLDVTVLNLYHAYKPYTEKDLLLTGIQSNPAAQWTETHNTRFHPLLSKQHSRASQMYFGAWRLPQSAPPTEAQGSWMCRRRFACTNTIWHACTKEHEVYMS